MTYIILRIDITNALILLCYKHISKAKGYIIAFWAVKR